MNELRIELPGRIASDDASEIETVRLRLRPFTTDDVDDLHRLWIDPLVRHHLWDDEVVPRERVASMIERSLSSFASEGHGLWAVFPRDSHNLIGFCGFWFFHQPRRLQLLYGIAPPEWGQGLATEVAQAMLEFAFQELNFSRIEASADAANVASQRVLEKVGMAYQQRTQENGLDTVYYAITRESWSERSRS